MERSSLRRELLGRAAPGIALLALGGLLLTWTAARAVASRDVELRDSRLSRVSDALEAADRSLRTLVIDIALSDEARQLVEDPAAEGTREALRHRLGRRYGVDFLAVLDGDGLALHVADPTGTWAPGLALAGAAPVERARRLPAAPFLWATPGGEIWLAGAPLGGRDGRHSGGTVLAGYVLTPGFVSGLGAGAGVSLRLDAPRAPVGDHGLVLRTLHDAGGRPAAVLVAESLSDALPGGGYWALATYFFASLFAGLVLLGWAAERSLVAPLLALRRGVEELRSTGRLTGELPVGGDDELGQLGAGIAALASELADSEFSRRRSEGQLDALLDATPDDIAVLDREGRVLGLKRSASEVSFIPAATRVGDSLGDLFEDALASEIAARVRTTLETGEAHVFEWCAREPGGRRIWEGRIVPAGRSEAVAIWRDISQRRRAEEARERLSAIVDATPDLIATASPDGRLRYVNPAARRALGLREEAEVTAHRLADFVSPDDRELLDHEAVPAALRDGAWSGELALETEASDEAVPVSVVLLAHPEPGGDESFLSVIARDISDRKRFEARLLHLADHDPLTDLLSRRRFSEELGRTLVHGRRYGEEGALVFLDLDEFKFVNDSLGHAAGDELLIGIARLLQGRLRRSDSLARLGGDEFAVLLPRAGRRQAEQVVSGLLEAMRSETFRFGERRVGVTASAGIVLFPEHGSEPAELLARADLAMYQAKSRGRNVSVVFEADEDWEERVESRLHGEQRIREALDRDRFVLYAQPLLDLRTRRIEEFELLLRMRGEDGRVVRPGAFLGVAERFGLIHAIDRWVVREAIRLLATQRAAGRLLRVSANLSGRAFEDRELPGLIKAELASRNLLASSLALEVTESAAIADTAHAEAFAASLKELGCRFALDDFGAGFSSLYHLKNLPVDVLKIDGSFVRDIARNPVDVHLVRAIVEVGRALRKETVAEYVTDEATIELLARCGVDHAQGYWVGKPGPAEEVFELYGTTRPLAAAAGSPQQA